MAWTDQCKYAFVSNAKALLVKDKKRNVSKVLRILSKDSGVPPSTLKKWWYAEATEIWSKTGPIEQPEKRMCEVCGINIARTYIGSNGKVKYHSRCGSCEIKTRPHHKKFWMICAHCGEINFLTKNDLKPVKSEEKEEEKQCQTQEGMIS